MTRWKAIPWVLVGVALLAVSLVAAGLSSPHQSANGEKPQASTPAGGGGPTVLGTFGTTPEVFPLFPPGVPAMASLTVKKIHVKEGATVHPGDVLIEFDPSTVLENKTQAEYAVTEAEWLADQARKKFELHSLEIERAKLGVKKAQEEYDTAKLARDIVKETLEEALALKDISKGGFLTEEEKEVRRRRNENLQKTEAAVRLTAIGLEGAKIDLKKAEVAPPLLEADADVQRANAAVARLKAAAAQATAVLESFKLKAQVAGTVELISVVEGMAVGPANRTPLMYLIPSGPRIVRAEVEAEFAHKIDDYIGKPVTIRAGQNFNDTYPGVARRVSGAFLPKRFGSDALVGNQTRALECIIEVTDPAPAGKTPLRPGQPVRVTFGN